MNIVEPNCLPAHNPLKTLRDGDPYGETTSRDYQGDGRDYPCDFRPFRKIEAEPDCLTPHHKGSQP